jgi:hypothetical protein
LSRQQKLSRRIFFPTLVVVTRGKSRGHRAGAGGAARGAPRLRASRYEKLAVRYLATIRIAAINEWLPRHL